MRSGECIRGLKAVLLDLDGVVYRGDQALPGAEQFFAFLRERGLRFCLITNNSTKTPEQFAAKLARMGIAVDPSEVLTSAEATASYLAACAPPRSRVLVVGGHGLRTAIRRAGFGTAARQPEYVVVGLDVKLTYAKLRHAAIAIRRGARFIASNADPMLPTEDGVVPGAGAIVAALEVSTGVSACVIGKPEPLMLELAMRRLGVSAAETAIVGDQLETDVLAGHSLGMCTVLVFTGVTTREALAAAHVKPDLVFGDLRELRHVLAEAEPNASDVESALEVRKD